MADIRKVLLQVPHTQTKYNLGDGKIGSIFNGLMCIKGCCFLAADMCSISFSRLFAVQPFKNCLAAVLKCPHLFPLVCWISHVKIEIVTLWYLLFVNYMLQRVFLAKQWYLIYISMIIFSNILIFQRYAFDQLQIVCTIWVTIGDL